MSYLSIALGKSSQNGAFREVDEGVLRLGHQKGSLFSTRTVTCIVTTLEVDRYLSTASLTDITTYSLHYYYQTTARMIVTSEPLETVKALRHTDDNSPTSTDEGLDFERCSALHNAIVKHAWVSSGFDLSSLPESTIWSLQAVRRRSFGVFMGGWSYGGLSNVTCLSLDPIRSFPLDAASKFDTPD